MTALRERMTEDLILRGLSLNTQAAYLRAVTQLARYYRRSPERISEREVAAYLLHLYREKGRSHSTCNQAVAALRFLYSGRCGGGSRASSFRPLGSRRSCPPF